MKKLVLLLLAATVFLVGCQLGPVVPERPPESRIAFMTDRDGNFEIYVMERDGSQPVNLTNTAERNEGLPTWSQRLNSLAYVAEQDSGNLGLQRMDAGGNNMIVLSDNASLAASPPAWSPTGQWVAFGQGDQQTADVYLADAAGEQLVNITDSPAFDLFAAWSPDGSRVLFLSDRDGNIAIYSVPVTGGEATALTDTSFGSGRPAFSPDGQRIAFMSNMDGDIELYAMDADGRNIVRLTENPGFDGFPLWSPNGSKIMFLSGRDGNAEIYVMNADGSNPVNLTNTPDTQESVEGDFSWSPDGQQILFHSNGSGNVEVYVMNADGSDVTNLTNNNATDFGAVWIE